MTCSDERVVTEPAYIAIGDDGYLTLYWGDGTEAQKIVLARGPRAGSGPLLMEDIELLCLWAWEQGYEVVTPAYDLAAPPIALEPTQDDLERLDPGEIEALLDDLNHLDDLDAAGAW